MISIMKQLKLNYDDVNLNYFVEDCNDELFRKEFLEIHSKIKLINYYYESEKNNMNKDYNTLKEIILGIINPKTMYLKYFFCNV